MTHSLRWAHSALSVLGLLNLPAWPRSSRLSALMLSLHCVEKGYKGRKSEEKAGDRMSLWLQALLIYIRYIRVRGTYRRRAALAGQLCGPRGAGASAQA